MMSASLAGQMVASFRSASPVAGLLYLYPSGGYGLTLQVYSGDITVDIDGDGAPDYAASVRNEVGVEIPITLDVAGRDIVLDLQMSCSWFNMSFNYVSGQAIATWSLVFLPNTFGLEVAQVGCSPLSWDRGPSGAWRAQLTTNRVPPAMPLVAGVFLLGLAEQNTMLNVPPFCPLLVANPAVVVPTFQDAFTVGLTLPDVAIPLGLRFYIQGAWLDSQGQLFTSDSLRTM